MEQAGIIAQVDVPTPRISNLTAAWKASGKQVQVCLEGKWQAGTGLFGSLGVKQSHQTEPLWDAHFVLPSNLGFP